MQKLAFIFPGQGSQAVSMGKSLVESYPEAQELLEEASDTLGYSLADLLFTENDRLSQTRYTQPAILFVSFLAHKLFENALAVKPAYALGHSLGELSAVSAMGGLAFADALAVASTRGELMQKSCEGVDAGMMVALGLSDDDAQGVCEAARAEGKQVWAANFNSDGQIVLAGIKADLKAIENDLKAAGAKRALLLEMSVASHCPLQALAGEPLQKLLLAKLQNTLNAPIISNVTAQPYQTKTDAARLLADQLTNPVLYKQSIKRIENDIDLFIEFGHGGILKGLNKKITAKPTLTISNSEELETVIEELAGGAA